jgi:ArsR family metal-binding transcriptional regulator
MHALTTFADRDAYERACAMLARLGVTPTTISPDPAYRLVGVPALVVSPEQRAAFTDQAGDDIMAVGWVDYREPAQPVPDHEPPEFTDDAVGRIAIVMLAPCVADPEKLRLTAHLSGDLAAALPYVNAELVHASYVAKLPVLSLMDGHRMVSIYRDRIAIAKADDIIDAWATLERLRSRVNDVWSRRAEITPSYELRRKPPFVEIYKRLPGTNCKRCGQATCMAFAAALWRGEADPRACEPVFSGERGDLKDAFLQICSGLGVLESNGD